MRARSAWPSSRRCQPLYGDGHDFGSAARKLVDVASFMAGEEPPAPTPSLSLRNGYELPLGLRIQLGERVGAGQPLDADIALCWLLATPDTYPRTLLRSAWADRHAALLPDLEALLRTTAATEARVIG